MSIGHPVLSYIAEEIEVNALDILDTATDILNTSAKDITSPIPKEYLEVNVT